MTENLKSSVKEIDRDLAHSWIDLGDEARELAKSLKLKTAGTQFASESDALSDKVERLGAHVEKIHADVIDLIENIEDRVPLPESISSEDETDSKVDREVVENEKIQVQREKHELRNDFKDVLKALFMWVDDPEQRAKEKR
ncbi:MAG: hypothetical protein AB8D78_01890 [Akkermansiaceae bacterium]